MKELSKQRPSSTARRANASEQAVKAPTPAASRRSPRVFRNSYTRGSRRFLANGWVVKLQHQGRRKTFSLRAKTKAAATIEARAICETLLAEGWEGVLDDRPSGSDTKGFPRSDSDYWKRRALVRRYYFPGSGGSSNDLAARIDHTGVGYWFPLRTQDAEAAADKACEIYERVVEKGWETVCREFSRELIVGFEWCANPILWTYTTIHTLVAGEMDSKPVPSRVASQAFRVLVVEADAGIRRALQWCVNHQDGFVSAGCDSVESCLHALGQHKPHLVLLNRNLAERSKFTSPGQIAEMRNNIQGVTYSVAMDGDQLFVSTPGGAEGYFIKRVKPDRLFEPLLDTTGRPDLSGGESLERVKSWFKKLLQPRSGEAASVADKLTRRENEVLALLSKGCVDKEIAQALGISTWTVHGHIKNIFERLHVRTRTEAVVRYLEK